MWKSLPNNRFFKQMIQLVICLCSVVLLVACSPKDDMQSENPLNPERPISVTLWHYYSGHTKTMFDQLVTEFNTTVGIDLGIVVDAQSQGDTQQLETAVFNAANNHLGAEKLPDIFAAYPDNAYRVNQLAPLVNFEDYFTTEELSYFQQDFLNDGRFGNEQQLHILPIAKSTENLFLNKTAWDAFAQATHTSIEQLSTWEGIIHTAQKYYDWSGGKAFLAIDSLSNFMLMSTMQLGEEMFQNNGADMMLNFQPSIARKIWDSYYSPFINGYYAKEGRFGSDDTKVGLVIAYIGSTSSSNYFPNEVTLNETTIQSIKNATLPYPVYENGQPYAAQQGAGMAIVKSDRAHEYAATEFLKWFTNIEQNSAFAISTAYFPVKKEALQNDYLLTVLEDAQIETTPTLTSSIKTTLNMLDYYNLYGYKAFEGSFDVRNILNNHLIVFVQQDLQALEQATTAEQRAQLLATFSSDEHFNSWYESFMLNIEEYFKSTTHD